MSHSTYGLQFSGRIRTAALGGLFVLAAAGSLWTSAAVKSAEPTAGKERAVPVPTAVAVRKTVPVFLDYVGRMESARSVTLQAKVTGYLISRTAKDGEDVAAGDLLYEIDPRDYRVALDQSKAQLARETAAANLSRIAHQRNTQLTQHGWVARSAFDQSRSTLDQAEATMVAAESGMRLAQLNLEHTVVRAPFAGRLGKSLVHEGALIGTSGTPLNTLVQLDPLFAAFNVAEADLNQIRSVAPGRPIEADVLVEGNTAQRFRGVMSFIDNSVDRASGTVAARVTVENPDHQLLPGQFARIRLHIKDRPDALLVPQAAIGSNQLGKFLYVVDQNSRAEQRYVRLGPAQDDLVLIDEGIGGSDTIVVGNLQKVVPGALLKAASSVAPTLDQKQ